MPESNLYNNINEANITSDVDYRNKSVSLMNSLNSENKIFANYLNNTISSLNKQNEVLYKQDKLLSINNNYLNEQIQTINALENDITNKDRIIYTTNQDTKMYNRHINVLITTIIFSLIILFLITIYNTLLKPMYFKILVIVLIVIYVIYVFYTYNILHFHDIFNFNRMKSTLFNLEQIVAKDINKGLNMTEDTLINYVYGSKDNWKKKHCTINPNTPKPIHTIPMEEEFSQYVDAGYYIYDNSAPAQLMVPQPTKERSGKYGDRIVHTDMVNIDPSKPNYDLHNTLDIPINRDYDNTWTNNL
jgi:hypothetical protein